MEQSSSIYSRLNSASGCCSGRGNAQTLPAAPPSRGRLWSRTRAPETSASASLPFLPLTGRPTDCTCGQSNTIIS